jgi:replicative DNA helicase
MNGSQLNMKYYRITNALHGLDGIGKLVPANESVFKHIKSKHSDSYKSLYYYDDEQYKQYIANGRVKGITGQKTNKLFFDFDIEKGKTTLDDVKNETIEVCNRLIKYGIPENALQLYFTGSKGFNIEVDTNHIFSRNELENICNNVSKGIKHFDTSMYDENQIIRVPLTKNPKSGYYKIPLYFEDLKTLSIDQIIEMAKDVNSYDEKALNWPKVTLSDDLLKLKDQKIIQEKTLETNFEIKGIDLSQKPNWLTNCKYALSQGFFQEGTRDNVFTALAATYKSQGLPEDVIFGMLKGVASLQAKRNNSTQYNDRELKRIVSSVYDDLWRGGTYTCKVDGWLKNYCDKHGFNCNDELVDSSFRNVKEILTNFKSYLENIDDNTIKTGIEELDKEIRIQTSTVVGILGSPGSGKTTVALKMLGELNKSGRRGAFYSLDMGEPLIGQKLIQAVSNVSIDNIIKIYATTKRNLGKKLSEGLISKEEHDKELSKIPEYRKRIDEWETLVEEQTKYLDVSFKSAITVDQIKKDIIKQQEKTGQKIWLVMIDYAECLSGPHADSVANMNIIFQKLKDLANELQTCVVILLQPNKFAGDPGDPITSYRQIKGSSGIEQSCRIVMGIYREGYNPEKQDTDKYLTLTVLKNNMGKLAKVDAGFNGETGDIYKLTPNDRLELKKLRKQKEVKKETEDDF